MKKLILLFMSLAVMTKAAPQELKLNPAKGTVTMSKELLKDKIKGAWVAQTIGVTFGLPIEFNYNSTFVRDNQRIVWTDSSMYVEYRDRPGTYDDIYMDLTFMSVIEEKGIDAPALEFARSFSSKDYKLWFANQTARYNIQNGLKPPESGFWLNNPCANDIDFQIEADFAGLMSPGMVNSAVEICDRVGHIMNYGEGWYGGVYVASIYSRALVSDSSASLEQIVKDALEILPAESTFARCMSDVIRWHKEDPDDWKATWFKTMRKWGIDIGSPLGVFEPFNIDAKINAAWVLIGLLYGNGDYTRTFEIAARCGDDADCNPATAGGVLAAVKGFRSIPDYWLQGLGKVEDLKFKGTSLSLAEAYDMSYRHAEKMIVRNGGKVSDDEVEIKLQEPVTVPMEVSFPGHYPVARVVPVRKGNEITFEFEGIGFAVAAHPNGKDYGERNHVFNTEVYIDGILTEKVNLPTAINQRRFTPFWKYQMPRGVHKVVIKVLNPVDYAKVEYLYAVIYDDKPYRIEW